MPSRTKRGSSLKTVRSSAFIRPGATSESKPLKGGTPNAAQTPDSPTSPARPNPFRNRGTGTPAISASLPRPPLAPGIPSRCSNPVRHGYVARWTDWPCDAHNSASPSNADPTALRARRRERKLFARAPAPRRSRHATRGHAAVPGHAAKLLRPGLLPAA